VNTYYYSCCCQPLITLYGNGYVPRKLSKDLRVLVACEFSGVVRDAFRDKGHDAYSCDILPNDSKYHIQDDIMNHLKDGWDAMIAHPPCTYICNGSLTWLNRKEGQKEKMLEGINFCKKIMDAPINKIAMENPIGKLSTLYRKPDQIFRVFEFGHPFKKDVCLWLKNLPKLKPTNILSPPFKTFDFWSSDRYTKEGGYKKSITFQGVAQAMAEQWLTD